MKDIEDIESILTQENIPLRQVRRTHVTHTRLETNWISLCLAGKPRPGPGDNAGG